MKNSQKGNTTILVLIVILLIIGGGIYFYNKQKVEENVVIDDAVASSTISTTTDTVENKNTLPDSEFTKTSKDPQAKILAKGDVNNDGYEDAVIQEVFCGASCAVQLKVVLNNKNINATLINDATFAPAYNSAGAAKSEVDSVSINKDGIITIVGKGLNCVKEEFYDNNSCDDEGWRIIRAVTYKYENGKTIQLSVTPSSVKAKILKGVYEFSEFAPGIGGSNQTWVYKLNLKRDGGLGLNSLNIDGFQTLSFFYVNGVVSGENLDIVFDSYGEGNIGTLYKKGDILFTLKPTINGLGVIWNKMQPNIPSFKDRSVFVKPTN